MAVIAKALKENKTIEGRYILKTITAIPRKSWKESNKCKTCCNRFSKMK